MRRDRENQLDLADIGAEANASTHDRFPPPLGSWRRPEQKGNCRHARRPTITMAERRFPARIRIGVPPGGFGQRYADITTWLDANCGADGWAMTPSGLRGC
jgi:hypothetical protein